MGIWPISLYPVTLNNRTMRKVDNGSMCLNVLIFLCMSILDELLSLILESVYLGFLFLTDFFKQLRDDTYLKIKSWRRKNDS